MPRGVRACVGALFVLAACTGDRDQPRETKTGETPKAREYVEALMGAMYTDGFGLFPVEEGRCAARGWVDVIGADALVAAGVTPAEFAANHDLTAGDLVLTKGQEDAVIDVFYRCVDLSTVHFASCFGIDLEHSPAFRDFLRGELLGTNQESEVAARTARLLGVTCLGGA